MKFSWNSPWGKGRPGWHIECSVMATKHLGDTIDIHGGGQDLAFPHHENEIAQSESKTGKKFANYWMHNGYIMVDGEKMSKSLNNFFTVRDIRKEYDGDFIRFFLLSVQYRGPINFSDEGMKQVKQGYDRLVNATETLEFLVQNGSDKITEKEEETVKSFRDYKEKFIECMSDDLNTAGAIGALFELVSAINVEIEGGASRNLRERLSRLSMNSLTSLVCFREVVKMR